MKIRLCEGGVSDAGVLRAQQRAAIERAAAEWKTNHRLRRAPLWFEGDKLCAAYNIAGVLQAGETQIEVFPKLDAHLLDESTPDDAQSQSVLGSVLWMIEAAAHDGIFSAGQAELRDAPTSFWELWARLLATPLLRELQSGVPRRYRLESDDLSFVRGKIQVGAQVSRNWNRMDRVACAWDEFTPNTPLARLLACACRFLSVRVHNPNTRFLLENCLALLDDVEIPDAATALQQSRNFRFHRGDERFRACFDFARRLLQSAAHNLGAGESSGFAFFLEMDKVWENYVGAVLRTHYRVAVSKKIVGYLFPDLPVARIQQEADHFWQSEGKTFIGDSKYKHLAPGAQALQFENLPEIQAEELAGRVLCAADVRQLTVYAELARLASEDSYGDARDYHLLLLYPYVEQGFLQRASTRAWNGSRFSLVPVSPFPRAHLADCLAPEIPAS